MKYFTKLKWREDFSVLVAIAGVKTSLFVSPWFVYLMAGREGGTETFFSLLAQAWNRWDSVLYLAIAEGGYQAAPFNGTLIAFLPLYPMLVSLGELIVGSYIWSGLIIANFSSMAGWFVFYKLAELEFGKKVAWGALAAIMLFPAAYFWQAPYSESLFLLTAGLAFYGARTKNWMLAGVMGGLATFTRSMGLWLLPALLWEFVRTRKESETGWAKASWLLMIPGSFGVYMMFNYEIFGSAWYFLEVQRVNWYKSFSWPWQGIGGLVDRSVGFASLDQNVLINGWAELLAAVFMVIGLVAAWRILPTMYAIYLTGLVWMVTSVTFLLSLPRFILSAFPLFFLVGFLQKYRGVWLVWMVLSVLLLTQLMNRFIHGVWAF